jgi:hypothetical protein
MDAAADNLLSALAYLRKITGKPLEPYERENGPDDCEMAGKAILDAAQNIGLNLGAKRPHQLDLRPYA